MANDPLYGSEVAEGGGLFPTTEILSEYLGSGSVDRAPVSDNSDIDLGPAADSGEINPDLINEYERFKPLHNPAEINDHKLDLPPTPTF